MSVSQKLRDQMFGLVERWRNEGGVQRVFCEQHGISVLKFQYWHKRYKDEKALVVDTESSFVRLGLPTAPVRETSIVRTEVIYPSGMRILLSQEVNTHFLKSLL